MIYGFKNKTGEYYNQDQFNTILPYVKQPLDWFLLGGPADGNEAQCALAAWPGCKVLAVEAYEPAVRWQAEHGWPGGHTLLNYALAASPGKRTLYLSSDEHNGGRASSLQGPRSGGEAEVDCISLDQLDVDYGPIENAFLWMDIEGYEHEALLGAVTLLERGAIRYINLEMMEHFNEQNRHTRALLDRYSFQLVYSWDNYHDFLYERK